MESRRIYGLDEIRAFIAGPHDGKSWSQARQDLICSLAQHFLDEYLSEADYEALGAEIEARVIRHRRADERNQTDSGRIGRDEVKADGSVHITRHVGGMMPGVIGHLTEPVAQVEVPEPLRRPSERRHRGPSKYDAKERADRSLERMRQAKLAKCPAEIWNHYKHAERGPLSLVLYDIVENGECVRPIERIAGAVRVSPRTVQTMLARAQARRELLVERRTLPCGRSIPNRITLICPEIQAYQEWTRGRDQAQASGSPTFFYSASTEIKGPLLEGANSIILPFDAGEDDGLGAVEAAPEVVEDEPIRIATSVETTVSGAPDPVQSAPVDDPVPDSVYEPTPRPSRDTQVHRATVSDKLVREIEPSGGPMDARIDAIHAQIGLPRRPRTRDRPSP